MIGNRTSVVWLVIGLTAAISGMVGACAPSGTYDNPVVRELTWFDYLNANDIRATCAPGAAERYRFVYNGIYVQQVRTYDLTQGPQGDNQHSLKVRVVVPRGQKPPSGENPDDGMVSDPLQLLGRGPGVVRLKTVTDAEMDTLRQALADSGFFEPPPKGTYLHSEDFYWIGAACVDGTLFFNAYKWPSERFKNAKFPHPLLSWDATGIRLNPPRELSDFDIYGDESQGADKSTSFTMTVGENGLVGAGSLF